MIKITLYFFIANDLDMKEKYSWRKFPFEKNLQNY